MAMTGGNDWIEYGARMDHVIADVFDHLDDAPCLEEYLNSPRDTLPAELLSDICLPLK